MSKPKILSNIINAKFPDTYEICVTYRIFKKQENDKKIVSAKCSYDAGTIKTLISHHFSLLFKNHAYLTDIMTL